MSEWSIEHAWKSDLFTPTDAQQNPPTHVRSISSRYNEVLRDAPVKDDIHRGFRGVCDTVLTQFHRTLKQAITDRYRQVLQKNSALKSIEDSLLSARSASAHFCAVGKSIAWADFSTPDARPRRHDCLLHPRPPQVTVSSDFPTVRTRRRRDIGRVRTSRSSGLRRGRKTHRAGRASAHNGRWTATARTS